VINSPSAEPRTLQARVLSASFVLLTGSGLATAVNFAYNIAVAQFLGPVAFGHASAVYTLLILISAITLSCQIVSAKVVAQQDSPQARSTAYRGFHRAAWASGILVGLVLLVLRTVISTYLRLPSSDLVVLLGIGAAFYVPLGSRRGYLQGACGFRRLAGNLVLEGSARLIGSLLLIAMGFGVEGVIAANAFAVAIAYVFAIPRLPHLTAHQLQIPYAFREALQAIVFFVGQVVINNCDIVVVKHLFPPEPAGLYAAVALVGRVIFAFSWAVVNTMFPIVAGTRSQERRDHSVLGTSLLLVLGIGSVLAFGLRVAPATIWTSLFGSQFVLTGKYGLPYLLALYAAATCIYSLSVVIIAYEMSYKIANTGWVQLAFSGALIAGIYLFHSSLQQVIWVQLVLMTLLLIVVAAPFVLSTLTDSESARRDAVPGEIRLLRRVPEDQVIAEFLKNDFQDPEFAYYQVSMGTLVSEPDLNNADDNAKRRALFFIRHGALWRELPRGTQWFEAELQPVDLHRIRVFPRAHWRKLARGDFAITEVAERIATGSGHGAVEEAFLAKIQDMSASLKQEADVGAVLLIGLTQKGPFTILDGNHRLVAATITSPACVPRFRFFCGLSPRMTSCCWYRTNAATLIHYGANLLRHLVHDPEADLERLLQSSP
jgi:O-antigen/teichoic acid export membrane protein